MKRSLNCIAALCIAASLPLSALAESSFQTGTGPLSSSAKLDFQVTIPAILYLRVGAGPASVLDNSSTVSTIDFKVPPAFVGNADPMEASSLSGDQGRGRVTARIVGNTGQIEFSAATSGPLTIAGSTGNSDSISWSQIGVKADPLATPTPGFAPFSAPVLADNASPSTSLVPTTGRLVQQEAVWTFTYLNSKVVGAGTYGDSTSGNGGGNGRVTYTASIP